MENEFTRLLEHERKKMDEIRGDAEETVAELERLKDRVKGAREDRQAAIREKKRGRGRS